MDVVRDLSLIHIYTADYRTIPEGIELEVLDADEKRLAMLFFRWEDVYKRQSRSCSRAKSICATCL